MPGVPSASGSGIWSRRRDEITFDRLQKFWNDLPPQARQELLKLDKQTLIEQARKNFYCSRCNGLLLESFSQIVIYGKSLQQEASDISQLRTTTESRITQGEQDGAQDPSVHPWGGLSTTKDGVLTLLDCFIKAKSLRVLQNVFDNARAREREREMLYPDACGAGGRGWISQGMVNYRGHGTREMCALHTAHLSCDTLVDFWSALGEETRSSLLRMKEEDFIEKLMYRFDSKRFCRECRRNVIREFKELKELKRMRREPHCTSWFCVTDTAFQCEVFEDAVIVDWRQCLSEPDGSYHHFEWAIGTDEGESDIFGFEDVGMNAQVHRNGINLDQFEDYFITLRAWRLDGHYTELCVKAHALKGQSCVHHRLVVGDGFVTMTKGESIRNFFEHAEEAEEEDEDDAMDRDGNDFDGDGSHPQKHAKSPELAREFLLDAAAVIFKEQVEKAFREGTAQQNAHSVFVSLALKLLEERLHIACKEIITLEKQNKLLEEEEKEKREEQERRMKRRTREREKKLRRKERLKEKENKGKRLVELKSPDDVSSLALSNLSTSTNDDSTNTLDSRDSATEEEDNAEVVNPRSCDSHIDQSSCMEINGQNSVRCNAMAEFSLMDSSDLCTSEQSKSSKRSPRLREDFPQDQSCWYDDCQDEYGRIGDLQWQSRERARSSDRSCNAVSTTNNRTRDRHAYNSCSCGHQEDYGVVNNCFLSTARSGREMKMARKSGVDKPRVQYRRCYPLDNFVVSKATRIASTQKNAILKQVWEPMDARKTTNLDNTDNVACSIDNVDPLESVDCDTSGCQKLAARCESQPLASESSSDVCKSDQQCGTTERSQAAACDGTLTVNKQNCYPGNDEGSRHDEELMMNSAGSDGSSSCMSEGDRESSSSSMTSLSAQNPESSSSESEESPDRTKSTVGTPSSRTASRSLLEACAGNGFREYQPKATRLAHNDRLGFNTSPFQDQLLRQQSMHVSPYSPATMGLHNRSWAAQTNGNFHYARPTHLYSSPLVFGAPGNHFVDYPVQYSSVNPYLAPAFSHMPPEPIHTTPASFRAMPLSTPFRNGPQHIAGHAHREMNLERHPAKLTTLSGKDLLEDKNRSGLKDLPEDKNKSQDADASFSLFQFNLPIASPVTPSSKDDKNGELTARTPLLQVQAQLCSREQADVKEYNLFSSKDNGIFSCSKDNDIFSFM
ncbi:hypothetical protein SETIT_9G478700v2 [Setaria italica]|uniref:Uncharacterized protein n=1 Tax=Setaria italica TaxID=4555 RepID=K4A510_SETIT|nr:uncharacterized protein LOC101765677 [Setaria italica]RCV45756.1 hypothetical protein SETIT_9G478700v2 [Setaria italica]